MTTDTTRLKTAVAEVAAKVESAMHADLARRLAGSDPLLREVVEYSLFSGGKRIRPFLLVLSSRCCGRDDADLYTLAAALEYLHTATLMHDDVVDHAPLRRGLETAVQRYSLEDAILAGDWLHARSLYLVGKFTGTEGLDVFCSATEGLVNGEFVQKRLCGDCQASEDDYFAVITQKTGNLIASSCALGALYAGADSARGQALQGYGKGIGIAFQIVDDLLDYTGQQAKTGKETGNDFQEGKLTLPLIRALAAADPVAYEHITKLIKGDRTTLEARLAIYAAIEGLEGFQLAAESAKYYVAEALQQLALFSAVPAADQNQHVELLQALAGYILVRKK